MTDLQNEKIEINNKVLQYGVLSGEHGYQLYLYPGMTVAELAFNVMVTIRLLEQDGYIKEKDEFLALIEKYYNDPQYAPIGGENDKV
jgi:hypothetical protein